MTLNRKTREIWADKTLELTNIGAGALIFGQFLSEGKFSFLFVIIGLLLISAGYLISFILLYKK